jgi:hypothetical protein
MAGFGNHSDRAMKSRLGALEFRHEILERNRGSPIREDGVKVEDAVEFVHAFYVYPRCSGILLSRGTGESKA